MSVHKTLLQGEQWGVIRGLLPDLSKCARQAFSLFIGMQQMYMPIWNPAYYKATVEAKIAQCVDPDEFIKLNAQLNAQLLACYTTTPEVERRAAALWNEKVRSHWYPTLHTFRSLARKKIDDKLADEVRSYEAGVLSKAMLDRSFKGRFDYAESYSNGIVQSVESDDNADGVFDHHIVSFNLFLSFGQIRSLGSG